MKPRPVWIIWYAVALHALWGVLVLVDGAAEGATPLSAYRAQPRAVVGLALLAVAALAAYGVSQTRRHPTLAMLALMPQQGLLSVSAMASVLAVAAGKYGDGVVRPRLFIMADQAPIILTLVLHTLAVVLTYMPRPGHDALREAVEAVRAEADRLLLSLGGGRPSDPAPVGGLPGELQPGTDAGQLDEVADPPLHRPHRGAQLEGDGLVGEPGQQQ
jgi:hypothetical protein